ncbi:hypothetical protein ACJX0J_013225, partial [Zea mays]
ELNMCLVVQANNKIIIGVVLVWKNRINRIPRHAKYQLSISRSTSQKEFNVFSVSVSISHIGSALALFNIMWEYQDLPFFATGNLCFEVKLQDPLSYSPSL